MRMPQPLRRMDAPIDWGISAVANHPVLTSGVGACITAFASTEALMGVFLAMTRWQHAPLAIETWAAARNVQSKPNIVEAEARLSGPVHVQMAVETLDSFVALSKRRSKLAHGYFGIILDRENTFAWREGGSAARRMSTDLASNTIKPSLKPPTFVYTPKDFRDLAQACADVFQKIGMAIDLLPIIHGLTSDLLPLNPNNRPPDVR
jgi:hypothetical protein